MRTCERLRLSQKCHERWKRLSSEANRTARWRLVFRRSGFAVEFDVDGLVHVGRADAGCLEGGDFVCVLQREANVVEAFEETVAAEGIHGEGIAQAAAARQGGQVGDDLLFEIDGKAVAVVLL